MNVITVSTHKVIKELPVASYNYKQPLVPMNVKCFIPCLVFIGPAASRQLGQSKILDKTDRNRLHALSQRRKPEEREPWLASMNSKLSKAL